MSYKTDLLAEVRGGLKLGQDEDGHSGSVVEASATVEAGVGSFIFFCLFEKKSDIGFCLFIFMQLGLTGVRL